MADLSIPTEDRLTIEPAKRNTIQEGSSVWKRAS
jgi:hypothetical protein